MSVLPLVQSNGTTDGSKKFLSTDEFASGDPALVTPPDLISEGAFGNLEASSDFQIAPLVPSRPVAPLAPGTFFGHFSWLDGDGLAPFGGLGIGLVEPNPPTLFSVPGLGDDVDAFDYRPIPMNPTLYFSLDADWMDPFEGAGTNASPRALARP